MGVDNPGLGNAKREVWDGAIEWERLLYLMDKQLHLITVHV